jgi:cellulose synthase/poly-beta-1,6-N-acetylglucosamine synthase-like glycosyltransferase
MKEALLVLQYGILFFWSYWLLIGLFGLGKAKKLTEQEPTKRFAIFIPAHNEETVIRNLLENLSQLDYPKHMYDTILIADNSNDRTAAIGRELKVTVIEHTSPPGEPRGKPYAIKYALDYLQDCLTEVYDAIVIFDADNLVSLNYLKEMNNHLLKGERLIQCYLDSKNHNDTWVTNAYSMAYFYMNRSWQLAKYRLKLGNAVGGTGFCVDTKLIQEVGWTARSLTEDLEFTMQCLLIGERTTWAHHARVYDEKPVKFSASWIQRLRWARGHWDVCLRYAGKLLWRSVTKADIKAFDGVLYLINPGKAVLSSIVSGIMLLSSILHYVYGLETGWVDYLLPLYVWVILIAFNLFYLMYCIEEDAEDNVRVRVIKSIISMIILNVSYIPLFVWGLVTRNSKVWKRTEHTRDITFEDTLLDAVPVGEPVRGSETLGA